MKPISDEPVLRLKILPDGTMMVPRGSEGENRLALDIVEGACGPQPELRSFLGAYERQVLYGDTDLCG